MIDAVRRSKKKQHAVSPKSPATQLIENSEPDARAAQKLVLELMAIPGASGQEAAVVNFIRDRLLRAGISASAVTTDKAHKRSPVRGEIGNLICKFPGTLRGPRRLLMAHVDTVPLCVGSRPRLKDGIVISGNADTALGADDRSGAAVVLSTALAIVRRKLPHPPLTFLWPVQEEIGLQGARFVTLSQLGRPQLAFNWDGGSANRVTLGATGAYRIQIKVCGIASHAGAAPEKGVSAIAIAGLAVAHLQREGWLGDVRKRAGQGTSNLGTIQGGNATNVVPDVVEIRGECRSHDPDFRREILSSIEQAFETAAAQLTNSSGQAGRVEFESIPAYESFALSPVEACVTAASEAVRSIGREPQLSISNGGLDANWLTARGVPTVTLGCGQQNAHMLTEQLVLEDFHAACRIALRLATTNSSSE